MRISCWSSDVVSADLERSTVLRDDPGSSAGSEGADGATVASITTRRVDEPEPDDGRRRRSARTRRRIFEAANELFALHGYDGTTTEMIAASAGITVPGLYLHEIGRAHV